MGGNRGGAQTGLISSVEYCTTPFNVAVGERFKNPRSP